MAVRHLEDALEEAQKELDEARQAQEQPDDKPAEDSSTGQVDEVSNPPTDDGDKAGASPAAREEVPPEPKKDEVGEQLENMNSVIRHRLEKQARKYEQELKDRDSKYDELARQFEEFKKQATPKKELTRDQFDTDEGYVAALTQQQIELDREKQAQLRKEQEEKDAAAKAEQDKAEDEIRQRQTRFLGNVEKCFEVPEEKQQFMGRVKTYLGKCLGELLDACPVASDYLLASPKGPKVLDRLLTDKAAFVRVFDPAGITPMDQYYELKALEKEIYGTSISPAPAPAPVEEPAHEPAKKAMPKYGKPGAQGGGRSADVFTDPKARRDEVRKMLGF
jgi:hypothetical protein